MQPHWHYFVKLPAYQHNGVTQHKQLKDDTVAHIGWQHPGSTFFHKASPGADNCVGLDNVWRLLLAADATQHTQIETFRPHMLPNLGPIPR
jgi:hypothetical protein